MGLTTKYKLAEQATRIIVGGNPTNDSQVTPREMIPMIDQAFASVVKRTYFEGRNEGEQWINGNFIYTFTDVAVARDKSRGVSYSELPNTSVVLPYEMQVYQVGPTKEDGPPYIPMPNGFSGLSEGLDVAQLENRVGYYVENKRIYYKVAQNKAPEKVMMKIVAPLGNVGEEDEVDISNDIQLEIVQLAISFYSQEQANPKDTLNDNIK